MYNRRAKRQKFQSARRIVQRAGRWSDFDLRRDGRVVEGAGLENRYASLAHRGFESRSLRHTYLQAPAMRLAAGKTAAPSFDGLARQLPLPHAVVIAVALPLLAIAAVFPGFQEFSFQ